jgi:hypothetical protein
VRHVCALPTTFNLIARFAAKRSCDWSSPEPAWLLRIFELEKEEDDVHRST